MPIDNRSYSMEAMSTLFVGENEGTCLHLAALLRSLFRPDSQYDFSLTDYAKKLFTQYDQVFTAYPMLKGVLNEFSHIGDVSREGLTDTMISRFVSEHDRRVKVMKVRGEGAAMLKPPRINQRFNGVPEMLDECFGPNSDLGLCMQIIAENKTDDAELVSGSLETFTDGGRPSAQKIDEFIDENWRKVRRTSKDWVKDAEFYSTARRKTIYAIHQRLDIASRWLAFNSNPAGESSALLQLHKRLSECVEGAIITLEQDSELPKIDRAVFLRCFRNLSQRLKGDQPTAFIPEDWLAGGFFPLDDHIPVMDETFSDIPYYEPWRNALRHISGRPQELEVVLTQIEDPDSALYDNYGQALAIADYIGAEKERFQISMKYAKVKAEEEAERFLQQIGLDFAYGRLSEQTREVISSKFEQLNTEFFDRNDYARLRGFRAALRRRADDEIESTRLDWAEAIRERQEGHESNVFLKQANQYLDKGSFLLVEETLNYFDSGADPSQVELNLEGGDFFTEFIDQQNYKELEDFCKWIKGTALRIVAEKWAKRNISTIGRYFKSAVRLLESLPIDPGELGEDKVKALLEELGFAVGGTKRENRNDSPARFRAAVKPDLKNRESYTHPIAEMGTLLPDNLNVMALFGNMQPKSIIDAVRKTNLKYMPIVFMNGYLTFKDRMRLAGAFLSDGNAQTPC